MVWSLSDVVTSSIKTSVIPQQDLTMNTESNNLKNDDFINFSLIFVIDLNRVSIPHWFDYPDFLL